MALSNLQLWNYLRGKYPNFANHTSEGTKDLFTARGFEQLQSFDSSILNDYFGLSLRVFLQKITVADTKDLLEGQGFGESYSTPYGGYVQRMSINSIKPVSPAFKGLQDGDSPDQFVVRKPDVSEQFWTQNFDYQSLVTMPDMTTYKNMFIQESGMSEFMAGVMKALANGYKVQAYSNKIEAINAAINSVTYALRDGQQFETKITDIDISGIDSVDEQVAFASEYTGFVNLVRNIVDSMVYTPATGAFNQAGFETTQDISRLKILVRPTLANNIASIAKLVAPESLALPIDIVKVPDFGGLIPIVTANETYAVGTVKVTSQTPTYNVYKNATFNASVVTIVADVTNATHTEIFDTLGTKIADAFTLAGGIDTAGDVTVMIPTVNVRYSDPNEDVIAIIADKGLIFENVQNPYTVEPARNARGLYTNFWASSVNNGIVVDRYKNLVVIRKQSN